MSETSKELMRRFVDEVWNKKNRQIVYEVLTPDFRHYMPGSKDPLIGPEAYQQAVDFFFMAFPKGKMNIDEVFAEGGRVCLLYTFTGIHEANFNGIEATNRKLEFSGVGIGRISEGKIEEIVSIFDNASLFAALAN
jgi:steroid delta-isomerase-like uncharacterized protein